MANNLDHLPKCPNPVFFDTRPNLYVDSAIDYEKMAVDMVDMREKILSSLSISDKIALTYGESIAGTIFGQPVNLHNYPNIGFHKELSLRETLQKEIDRWLS